VTKKIKNIHMKAKKENYWFIFRLLLLMNVVLIAVMLMSSGFKDSQQKETPCSSTKKINADIFNSVTVKLM
jgi:hypothetical protein